MTRALAGAARVPALAPLTAGALSGSLFAASLWIPPLGFLLSVASPLPVAIEAWRRGAGGAAIAVAAGLLAALVLGGPVGAGVYFTQFAMGGVLLGLLAQAGRSPTWVVGGFAGVSVLAFWASMAWMANRSGLTLAGFIDQTLADTFDRLVEQLLAGDLDAQTTLAVQTWAEQTRGLMVRAFPGMHGVLAVLTGWANALLLRRAVGAQEPWHHWKAPESWIWILIGSGLVGVAAPAPWGTVALNVFLVAVIVYFLQGLAITQFLFHTKNFPRIFRVAAYALLFLQLPVMLLVAGFGAFDLWFDFRARLKPPADDSGSPRS